MVITKRLYLNTILTIFSDLVYGTFAAGGLFYPRGTIVPVPTVKGERQAKLFVIFLIIFGNLREIIDVQV